MNPTRDIQTLLRERVVPAGGSRHGLVVGIESYHDSRLNLRCAGADARSVYELMTDPECGMFPQENVRLLLDGEATRENVWRAFSGLRRVAGENDTVWVYYAGHAAPEESNIYWVTHDANVDDLYGTGLANDQIAKVLDDIRARQLLVLLDCCHAAASSIQKNPTRAALTAEEVFAGYQGKGRITLSSSDGKEKSVELSDVGHGAFTYFLQKGLRGEADRNGDGVVSADELWDYLHQKVTDASQKAGNRQTPVLMGQMTHDLALTLNPTATRQKKRIAEAIEGLIGLGDDRLTTQEAKMCLGIVRRGPQTSQEKVIYAELENLVGGKLAVATFKLAIQSALQGLQSTQLEKPRVTEIEGPPSSPEAVDKNLVDRRTAAESASVSAPALSPARVRIRRCARCAETIRLEAVLCRYCGYSHSEAELAAGKELAQAEAQQLAAHTRCARLRRKMRRFRIWGYTLAVFGCFWILAEIGVFFSPPVRNLTVAGQRIGAVVGVFLFGLPPLSLGVLLLHKARKISSALDQTDGDVREEANC